jgi:cytochrome c peroxidase
MKKILFVITLGFIIIQSCKRDIPIDKGTGPYAPTPYYINYPMMWSRAQDQMLIPANNPMTVEGVSLGRKLFYDPILSQTQTMSCATCHGIEYSFSDHGKQFSDGLHGEKGVRNAMPLFNLGWGANYGSYNHKYFWDGSAPDMEAQVIGPITNPIEMSETLPNVLRKLQNHPEYPSLFKKAFGTDSITTQLLEFAIAQFERTLISGNSKYDQGVFSSFSNFTQLENYGKQLFFSDPETNPPGADCFHCHTLNITPNVPGGNFGTDFLFHNNGSQQVITDSGLARIEHPINPDDMGKFRTPSLRNLVFTAPYMHDGRFKTLEEVVDFYNTQAHMGTNADAFITKHPNGLNLSTVDKQALVAFLKTLTDSSFIRNPDFKAP